MLHIDSRLAHEGKHRVVFYIDSRLVHEEGHRVMFKE